MSDDLSLNPGDQRFDRRTVDVVELHAEPRRDGRSQVDYWHRPRPTQAATMDPGASCEDEAVGAVVAGSDPRIRPANGADLRARDAGDRSVEEPVHEQIWERIIA